MDTITPGSNVQVKVVKAPTNAAAIKTLRRVLAKDETIAAEHKRLAKVRASELRFKTRGGRPWGVRMKKQHPVDLDTPGASGVVLATPDVIRDLGSVERFVEVSPA